MGTIPTTKQNIKAPRHKRITERHNMTLRHTPYSKLTATKLHNTLVKRKTPLNLMEQIKERVRLRKEAVNKQRVEDRVRARRWKKLIEPLSRHIKTIQSNLCYHEYINPPTYQFYQDYLETLTDTRNTLTKFKLDRKATPTNHDRTKRDWTDYVDKETKQRLTTLYNALPRSIKANRRNIFPRPKQTKEKRNENNDTK